DQPDRGRHGLSDLSPDARPKYRIQDYLGLRDPYAAPDQGLDVACAACLDGLRCEPVEVYPRFNRLYRRRGRSEQQDAHLQLSRELPRRYKAVSSVVSGP